MRESNWIKSYQNAEHKTILEDYIMSPRHLKLVLDYILPISDLPTANHIYRAYVWLLFSGLSSEMAVAVSKKDLDFTRMYILHPVRYQCDAPQPIFRSTTEAHMEYPIYAEAVEDLQNACNMDHYYEPGRPSKHKVRGSDRYCKRAEGELILRIRRGDDDQTGTNKKLNSMKPVIRDAMTKTIHRFETTGETLPDWFPKHLTPKKIEMSGKYYRAFMEEGIGTLTWVDPHKLDEYILWKQGYVGTK